MSRLLMMLVLTLACVSAYAETFVVNTVGEVTTANGCDDECTLTDAFNEAASNDEPDRIEFALPGQGPFVYTRNAGFDETIEIDGYTQPGSVRNTLDQGTNAVFKIRQTGNWLFRRGAIDSTIRGIEFERSVGNSITNETDGVSVLGCLFEGDVISIETDGQIFVGSALKEDRNRFISSIAAIEFKRKQGSVSSGSKIVNNIFGRTADLGNRIAINDAIRISGGNNDIEIGGVNAGEGNVFSGSFGPAINFGLIGSTDEPSRGVSIRGNRFEENISIPIDLVEAVSGPEDGITPNDAGDGDVGVNGLLNFPVISSASFTDDGVRISGTLDVQRGEGLFGIRLYDVEFYANAACHSSGHGEGDALLAVRQIVKRFNSADAFSFDVPTTLLPEGAVITALVTDLFTGDTSEFSPCATVTGTPPPPPPPPLVFANGFE